MREENAVEKLFSPCFTLLAGIVLALVLNIPMTFLEEHLFRKNAAHRRLHRAICIVLSLFFILGIFAAAAFWVIPSIVRAVSVIRLPQTLLRSLLRTDAAVEALSELVKNAAVTCIRASIALVFAVYTLANKELLIAQVVRLVRAWLPKQIAYTILHAIGVTTRTFRSFIAGQTLEALILGSLCTAGMLILNLPYALMTGTLVGVTALFPVVGAYIGAAAGGALICTVDPLRALIFLIFLGILQQLENNLIYPKVVGSKVNLPAIWVLAAITIGGSLAGPIGMFLAVPTSASVYSLLREATQAREAKKEA